MNDLPLGDPTERDVNEVILPKIEDASPFSPCQLVLTDMPPQTCFIGSPP